MEHKNPKINLNQLIARYKKDLVRFPNDTSLLNMCGIAYFQHGKPAESMVYFQKALGINQQNESTHNNIGIVLNAMGRFQDAEFHFKKAIDINPNYTEAHINLGANYRRQGRLDEAVMVFQRAIKLNPDDHNGHSYLGNSFQEQGRLAEAINCFKRALSINSKDPKSLHALGNCYRMHGDLDNATLCYRQILAINPDNATAHHNLGVLLKNKSEFEDSIRHLKQALKLKPSNSSTEHELAAAIGQTTEAAPQNYIKNLFDQYAATFEDHITNELKYRGAHLLGQLLRRSTKKYFQHTIDLGCGSGLCGEVFKEFSNHLIGVDISSEMTSIARKKGIYDEVYTDCVAHFLSASTEQFDLFVAGDVFVYTGNLSSIFKAVHASAAPNANFIFSTEHSDQPNYTLLHSGRYAHHPAYIQQLAETIGFTIQARESVNLRKEQNEWIIGDLYALEFSRKSGTSTKDKTPDKKVAAKENQTFDTNSEEFPIPLNDATESQGRSQLFRALDDRQALHSPKYIDTLMKSGAIINNGNVLPPLHLPKLLTQYANGQNIRKIFTRLKKICDFQFCQELIVEVGSGDGYLKYLCSLMVDDPLSATIRDHIVETEPSVTVIQRNLKHGKYTLELAISDLPNYFSTSSVACLVSFNVMDLFPKSELRTHLATINDILKPNGFFIHIMSSCIHPQVFMDIQNCYPNRYLCPYQKDGLIGVRVLSDSVKCAALSAVIRSIPDDLSDFFAQSSDRYLELADTISNLCVTYHIESEPIIFKDYFVDKMTAAVDQTDIELIYQNSIESSQLVPKNTHHRCIPNVNHFRNVLGALYVYDAEENVPTNQVLEESIFFVICGRKIESSNVSNSH